MRALSILLFCAALNAQSLLQKASQVAPRAENPFNDDAEAPLAGKKLFERECAACHGPGGAGNGRRRTPPLASNAVQTANPGALFWILKNGSASHRMPSFSRLPEEQRWQLIRYLQRSEPMR